jgi:predicted nucleic acid-binding protein
VTHGLVDTSVLIALAQGEEPELPDQAAISIITLCELHHGVLVANDRNRAQRLATLTMAERRFIALPVDERVAPHYGALVAEARRRKKRPAVADTLIAATALAHKLPIYTADADFVKFSGIDLIRCWS